MSIRTRSVRRRAAIPALMVAVTVAVAACNPVFGETSGPVQHATLTSTAGFQYSYSGDEITVTASQELAFDDNNVREVFWTTESPYYADQQTCLTWDTLAIGQPGGLLQPGLAMRIAPTGPDGQSIKAITVTQNIWYLGIWKFNVHTWDSSSDPAHPFTQISSFDLSPIVGYFTDITEDGWYSSLIDAPWHLCARTEGDQFSFKVWTDQDATEPGWDDPDHVFTTTLPAGWDHAGYSGGYIGHLRENQTATFSGFTTTPLCLTPDMIDTPHCRALLDTEPQG